MSAPILYLTSEYPALSHTFVLREIAALRAAGQGVETASIRRTSGAHVAGKVEQAEAGRTFYVIAAATAPGTLLRAVLGALARPGRLALAAGLAWRTRAPGAKGTLWALFHLVEAMVLARHMERAGLRHLHVHFANAACTVGMLAGALSGLPFSFTLHGPSIFFEPRKQALGEKIARAAFVACISDFCRSQGMIFSDPADWPKMRIVHCGVEPARYGRGAGAGAPGQRLVFVGRLAAVKGVPVLLEAVRRLRERHPDLRLTLIGDGPERAALEAMAADLGERVHFAGPKTQDEVAALLREADLFVLPSFAEGVPVVLMEAMASGLPVVTSRIAGIPELVEDGVSGHLVPPGNVDGLTEAIDRVLSAPPEAQAAMGAAGRARIETAFDIGQEALKIGRLVEETGGA